jgi:hypothetical protein
MPAREPRKEHDAKTIVEACMYSVLFARCCGSSSARSRPSPERLAAVIVAFSITALKMIEPAQPA